MTRQKRRHVHQLCYVLRSFAKAVAIQRGDSSTVVISNQFQSVKNVFGKKEPEIRFVVVMTTVKQPTALCERCSIKRLSSVLPLREAAQPYVYWKHSLTKRHRQINKPMPECLTDEPPPRPGEEDDPQCGLKILHARIPIHPLLQKSTISESKIQAI